jgi:hypothetical protein
VEIKFFILEILLNFIVFGLLVMWKGVFFAAEIKFLNTVWMNFVLEKLISKVLLLSSGAVLLIACILS